MMIQMLVYECMANGSLHNVLSSELIISVLLNCEMMFPVIYIYICMYDNEMEE